MEIMNSELRIKNNPHSSPLPKRGSKKVVRDFIYYNQRAFTSSQIVRETGICYETIKKYLQELLAENYIRQIGIDKGKKVYIYNRNMGKPSVYKVAQKHNCYESIKERYRRQVQKQRDELDLL
jgi:predicted HTH transcriptional regulator